MYQVLSAGGWGMPFIVLCSIIAPAICLERRFVPSREKIAPPQLLATVWQKLRGEGLEAQRLKNLRLGSLSSAVLATGLVRAMADRLQGITNRPAMLSADALIPHQNVMTAMDLACGLGLERLAMATGSSSDD